VNSLSSITKTNNKNNNNDNNNNNNRYKTEFIDISFLSVTTNIQVAIENPKFNNDYRYHISTLLELKSYYSEQLKGIIIMFWLCYIC